MSWFTSNGLSSTFATLSDTVAKATESIKDAIPDEYKESLAKLTLNTEEMVHERRHFRDEAARKAMAKNRLGRLLPWETTDREREILVEECKEAILELSQNEETFFGPYEMPLLNVQLEDDGNDDDNNDDDQQKNNDANVGGNNEDEKDTQTGSDDQEHENSNNDIEEDVDHDDTVDDDGAGAGANSLKKGNKTCRQYMLKPSEESLVQLDKLRPLPPLLEEFDLDSHVGLIQRLLKEDPNLVHMQASHSGGGPRERVFWNNYFFHCAFTRYEAGLSIDEIWSYQQASTNNNDEAATGAAGTVSFNSMGNTAGGGGGVGSGAPTSTQQQQQEEETVDFDGTPNNPSSDPTFVEFGDNDNSGDGGVTNEMDGGIGGLADSTSAAAASTAAPDFAVGNDFELVDEDDGGVLDGTSGDPELDELEAEIARELEGL